MGYLRYGNEYGIDILMPRMGKTHFLLFNWSLFQSRSYNCT